MRHASAVEEIMRADRGRKPKRVRLKYQRMRRDVFAFFRGTDHLFARAWSDGLQADDPGPWVLSCGDLHLENFGAYRADDGTFLFDVNDFDEAAVAPCAFDLTRCVASILLAADVWRLPPVRAERVALAFLDRYREAVAEAGGPGAEPAISWEPRRGPVRNLLGRAAANTQAALLARQTKADKHGRPRIRRNGGLHPAISRDRAREVRRAVEAYGRRLGRPGAFRVRDVTGRVAGIGSLGVRRYLVLADGAGPPSGYLLLDLKEAGPSAVSAFLGPTGPAPWPDDARRVVEAQRRLQPRPAAGLDALEVGGRWFRMREMVPAEHRTSLDRYREQTTQLGRAVVVAGWITGWSQVRGARFVGPDRAEELAHWAAGAGLGAVLAAAVRHATRARRDYGAFCAAYDRHGARLLPEGLSDPDPAAAGP